MTTTTTDSVNVICMKWGDKYGPEYVNKLHNMVARSLSRPFRFICFTDEAQGINSGIEIKPIPKTGFKPFDDQMTWTKGNGWLKLSCFIDPLYDLTGKTLFLDLDIVITQNIDEFFKFDEPFTVIKEWSMNDGTGNTSVFLFKAGEHADALKTFASNPEKYLEEHRNEQEFISQYIISKKSIAYWPNEWCISFKYHCMSRGLKNWIKKPTLPTTAKIVIFHGNPNPPDAINGISPVWYKKVHKTPWISSFWK